MKIHSPKKKGKVFDMANQRVNGVLYKNIFNEKKIVIEFSNFSRARMAAL